MSTANRTAERAVLDLLVTWGATADAATADLLRLLVERRGGDIGATLRQVAALEERIPDSALRAEVQARLAEAADGSSDPAVEERAAETLERVHASLEPQLDSARHRLGETLRNWLPLLDTTARDDLLGRLWESERAEPPLGAFGALERLEEAERLLVEARRLALEATVAAAERSGSADLLGQVRTAAQAEDPEALLAIRRRLDLSGRAGEETRRGERLAEARRSLRAALDPARESTQAAAGVDPALGELLTATVDAAERALADEAGSQAEVYESWRDTLTGLVSEFDREATGPDHRLEMASRLTRRLEALGGDEASEAGGRLEALARAGGAEFARGWSKAARLLAQAPGNALDDPAPDPAVDKAAGGLKRQLDADAAEIPAEKIVEARLLLAEAAEPDLVKAADRPAELARRIEQLSTELKEATRRSRKVRRSRAEAERERIREVAERWIDVAPAGEAGKLKALAREIADADPADLDALASAVAARNRQVERTIRLEATGVLERAGARGGKKELDGADRGEVEKLEQALERDDLAAVRQSTERLRARVGKPSTLRGPLVPGLAAGALLLALAAALTGWRLMAGGPEAYVVRLDGNGAANATVSLYRDGRPFESTDYDPARGATFRLAPGRYEILVNDRFTGRVIQVPDDRSPIEGVPVPPGTP